MKGPFRIVWFALFLTGFGCATTENQSPLSLQALKTAEKNLIVNYRQGPARFDDLFAYFRDANPELFAHLDRVKKDFTSGQSRRGATYIAGASGVGKSYVIAKLGFPKEDTSEPIKLSKCFTETAPDLESLAGTICFNRLPYSADVSFEALLASHEATHKAFVLVDDLDEVHEETAKRIVQSLEAYVAHPTTRFQHIILLGRPESFWPWLSDRHRQAPDNVTDSPFLLVGPDYQTRGDIAYRCDNYFQWKHSEPAPPVFVADVLDKLDRYPFLRYTIRPLSAGNFVLKESVLRYRDPTIPQKTADQTQEALLVDLLDRNAQSHGRPDITDELYLHLLEQAAAFPLERKRIINDQGFFEVYADDSLSFTDQKGNNHQVYLRDILNRSGLAILSLSHFPRTYYRFEPYWIQMHLVKKWNRREHPDH